MFVETIFCVCKLEKRIVCQRDINSTKEQKQQKATDECSTQRENLNKNVYLFSENRKMQKEQN